MLCVLRHSNYLIKLIGYCTSIDQKLLVYEYMPNGCLEDHLFGNILLVYLFLSCHHLIVVMMQLKVFHLCFMITNLSRV